MGQGLDLTPLLFKHTEKLRTALRHPSLLLKQIGALVSKDCRRSFNEQRLGDILWEARYPGQKPPKLNIAGALADFISGRTAPKPNRFQERPAVVDEGMRGGIQGSITFNVIDNKTVRVGTNKPYAKLQQEGGESEQTYDKGTSDRIRDWLFPTKKHTFPDQSFYFKKQKKFVTHYGPDGKGQKQKTPRSAYYDKLKQFLPENWKSTANFVGGGTYRQQVIARPFIGVTDQAYQDIDEAIRRFVEKANS